MLEDGCFLYLLHYKSRELNWEFGDCTHQFLVSWKQIQITNFIKYAGKYSIRKTKMIFSKIKNYKK